MWSTIHNRVQILAVVFNKWDKFLLLLISLISPLSKGFCDTLSIENIDRVMQLAKFLVLCDELIMLSSNFLNKSISSLLNGWSPGSWDIFVSCFGFPCVRRFYKNLLGCFFYDQICCIVTQLGKQFYLFGQMFVL